MRTQVLIGSALLIAFSGCWANSSSTGTHGFTWIEAADDGIPGITSGGVTVAKFNSGSRPITIVLWVDDNGRFKGGSSDGRYEATLQSSTGKITRFVCEVPKGSSGNVTIDDQVFDLSDGVLFLMSCNESPVRVRQLECDIAQFTPEGGLGEINDLKEIVKKNPQILEFFSPPEQVE